MRAAVNEASRRVDEELTNQLKNVAGGIPRVARARFVLRTEGFEVQSLGFLLSALSLPALSLHVLAVVNFVFDVEGFLRLAIFPMLLGDEAIDLVEALGRKRVRTEVSSEALDGEFGQFFFGAARVDDVFIAELGQARERADGTIRRITGLDGEANAFAIGFEFFVFVIAGLPEFQRDLQQMRRSMSRFRFFSLASIWKRSMQ